MDSYMLSRRLTRGEHRVKRLLLLLEIFVVSRGLVEHTMMMRLLLRLEGSWRALVAHSTMKLPLRLELVWAERAVMRLELSWGILESTRNGLLLKHSAVSLRRG